MFDARSVLKLFVGIATKHVGCHCTKLPSTYLRYVKEELGRTLVLARLKLIVAYIMIYNNGTPKPMFLNLNQEQHLVQVPVTLVWSTRTNLANCLPKWATLPCRVS